MDVSWLRPMGTGRSARVLRLLEQSATEQSRRRARGGRQLRAGLVDVLVHDRWPIVDTRVLVRTDKWYGSEKAWPIWSFVTRAHAGAIDRDLSLDTTNAEISTDVSNVQLGGVQLPMSS